MPSEKQLGKLELVTDFYEEQYNKLEKLWFDSENGRKSEEEVLRKFYVLKDLEKPINKMVSEIIKTENERIRRLCEVEVREYLSNVFN